MATVLQIAHLPSYFQNKMQWKYNLQMEQIKFLHCIVTKNAVIKLPLVAVFCFSSREIATSSMRMPDFIHFTWNIKWNKNKSQFDEIRMQWTLYKGLTIMIILPTKRMFCKHYQIKKNSQHLRLYSRASIHAYTYTSTITTAGSW